MIQQKKKNAGNDCFKNLYILETLDRINQILLQKTDNYKETLILSLNEIIKIYNCDRAWLLYPCDPDNKYFYIPLECSKSQYTDDFNFKKPYPLTKEIKKKFQNHLKNKKNNVSTSKTCPFSKNFSLIRNLEIKSQLTIIINMNSDRPCIFGIQYCQNTHKWDKNEKFLFKAISKRISSALENMFLIKALKESEKKYKTLFNSSNDGIMIIKEKIINCNETLSLILDYPESEIIGKKFVNFSPQKQKNGKNSNDELKKILESAIKGKKQFFDWQCIKKDKSIVELEISLKRLIISQETILLGTIRDITRRKVAEEALRNNEEDLRITLNSIGDAVIATDSNGIINRINPIAENLTGYPANEAIKNPLNDIFNIINPKTKNEISDIYNKIINNKTINHSDNHLILISRNGTFHQISLNGSPIKNNHEQIAGIVIVFRDMTEQYRMEVQLRQSQKMESIGQLAGGIAHDFNNQLAGILGFAHILNEKLKEDPKLHQYAQNILISSQRAADLTSKLLAFARKGRYLSVPVNIHNIITEVISILQHSIEKNISIKNELKADLPTIKGDPSQLQNIFLNLALNARDAMSEGGILTFKTEILFLDENYCKKNPYYIKSGNYLLIKVIDTGSGISESIMEHIFEPFFTTKGKGKGTGMGLAAVYGTIKSHRGAINVITRINKGTEFQIYLPLLPNIKEEEELTKKEKEIIKGNAHILFVDDEKMVQDIAYEILSGLGYRVSLCDNGKQAVKYYEHKWQGIDLVILDMVMPEMGGLGAFLKMKKINPDIIALICSGYTTNKNVEQILKEGAKGFIQKPFVIPDISKVIANILKKYKK